MVYTHLVSMRRVRTPARMYTRGCHLFFECELEMLVLEPLCVRGSRATFVLCVAIETTVGCTFVMALTAASLPDLCMPVIHVSKIPHRVAGLPISFAGTVRAS